MLKKIIEVLKSSVFSKICAVLQGFCLVIMVLGAFGIGMKIEELRAENESLTGELKAEKVISAALMGDIAALTEQAIESEAICKEQLERRDKVQKIFENSGRGSKLPPPPPPTTEIAPRRTKPDLSATENKVVSYETSVDAINFINDIWVRGDKDGNVPSADMPGAR